MSRKTALLVLDMQEGIASSVPRIKKILLKRIREQLKQQDNIEYQSFSYV